MQQPETLQQPPLRDLHPTTTSFWQRQMVVLICGLKPLKCSCLVLGKKSRTSCMLGKWLPLSPSLSCLFISKQTVSLFLTLIRGKLALQISADCKNFTLQQPCRSWEGCSSYERSHVHQLGPREGHVGWHICHRGLMYDSIFGLVYHQLLALGHDIFCFNGTNTSLDS
jgi:hypothetical protein